MNPKIPKVRSRILRNDEKIAALQDENATLKQELTEMENVDIVGMVREIGMTPEQLADLLAGLKTSLRKEAAPRDENAE